MAEENKDVATQEPDGEAMLPSASSEDSASPIICADEELRAVDFSRLDVLVGTVRSDGQMDYCLEAVCTTCPPKRFRRRCCPWG